jgi:hypothetical protein
MKSNLGLIDRIIRVLLVLGIFYLYYAGWIVGLVAMGFGIIAVVLLVTAFTGDCFIYRWLGVNTKMKSS